MKVKLWLDGLRCSHHCIGDDETTKDIYDRASGEREDTVKGDVCTSTFRGNNGLLRAVQVGVEAFDIQQGGYLNRFYPLVVHVAGKQRREKLGDKFLYRNTEVVHISERCMWLALVRSRRVSWEHHGGYQGLITPFADLGPGVCREDGARHQGPGFTNKAVSHDPVYP